MIMMIQIHWQLEVPSLSPSACGGIPTPSRRAAGAAAGPGLGVCPTLGRPAPTAIASGGGCGGGGASSGTPAEGLGPRPAAGLPEMLRFTTSKFKLLVQ
jgi:hypothetical protein